jgi:hypothetical protein
MENATKSMITALAGHNALNYYNCSDTYTILIHSQDPNKTYTYNIGPNTTNLDGECVDTAGFPSGPPARVIRTNQVDVQNNNTGNVVYLTPEPSNANRIPDTISLYEEFYGIDAVRAPSNSDIIEYFSADKAGNNILYTIYKHQENKIVFKKFGHKGTEREDLNEPTDVKVCESNRRVYVSDSMNDRISVWELDDDGNAFHWGNIGEYGQKPGQFDNPKAISLEATDGGCNLYVADTNNNRIQKFNAEGFLDTDFGNAGVIAGFYKPTAISVNSGARYHPDFNPERTGALYIGDDTGITMYYNRSKRTVAMSTNITAIDIDAFESIYILDNDSCKIKKYTKDLLFIDEFGSCEPETTTLYENQFRHPIKGIAVSPIDGRIYITDRLGVQAYRFAADVKPETVSPAENHFSIIPGRNDFEYPFLLTNESTMKVVVYANDGTEVIKLSDHNLSLWLTGQRFIHWNGKDKYNNVVSPGQYRMEIEIIGEAGFTVGNKKYKTLYIDALKGDALVTFPVKPGTLNSITIKNDSGTDTVIQQQNILQIFKIVDPSTGNEITNLTNFPLPGKAYWITLRSTSGQVQIVNINGIFLANSRVVAGNPLPSGYMCSRIPLKTGYNFIGNPYPFTGRYGFLLSKIQSTSNVGNEPEFGPQFCPSISELGHIWGPKRWLYTQGEYVQIPITGPDGRLIRGGASPFPDTPFYGTIVYMDSPQYLYITPFDDEARILQSVFGNAWDPEFEIELVAEGNGGLIKDRGNYIGVSSVFSTTKFSDNYDIGFENYEPYVFRPFSDDVFLYFDHPNWDGLGHQKYSQDYRSYIPQGESKTWEFTVESEQIGQEVVIKWNFEQQSDKYSYTLINQQNNDMVNMLTEQNYKFTTTTTKYLFKVLISPIEKVQIPIDKGWNLIGISWDTRKSQIDNNYESIDNIAKGMLTYRIESDEQMQMYSCSNTNDDYSLQHDHQCGLDPMLPGTGYFVFNPLDSGITHLEFDGWDTNTNTIYQINLDKGWNIISNPYTHTPVYWNNKNVYVKFGTEEKTLSDARAAGWIRGPYQFVRSKESITVNSENELRSILDSQLEYDASSSRYFGINALQTGMSYRFSPCLFTDPTCPAFKWTGLSMGENQFLYPGTGQSVESADGYDGLKHIEINFNPPPPPPGGTSQQGGIKTLWDAMHTNPPWIDNKLIIYNEYYEPLSDYAPLSPWIGYVVKANYPQMKIIFNNNGIGNPQIVDFNRTCRSLQNPITSRMPVARMSSNDINGKKSVRKSINDTFDVGMYVENTQSLGAAQFTLKWDDSMLAVYDRAAGRVLGPGEDVPLSGALDEVLLSKVGNSIDVSLGALGTEPSGRVYLGTVSFKVLPGAAGKATKIDFDTSDPNLKIYGELTGRIIDYEVQSDPLVFAEYGFSDTSPPVITVESPCGEGTPNCVATSSMPIIRVRVTDPESWVSFETLEMYMDGKRITPAMNPGTGEVTYTPPEPLQDKRYYMHIKARGLLSPWASKSWNFLIDTKPVEINVTGLSGNYISPNNDGVKENVSLKFGVNETGTFSARVYSAWNPNVVIKTPRARQFTK